jgi:peroxiredoxin
MRVLLLLLTLAGLSVAQLPIARRAPGFTLPDLTYKYHDLQDYRGKVVLIDIMRTECPKCQTLTAALEQVKSKYADKIIVFSVVNPPADTPASVNRYIQTYKASSTFLLDCGQMVASYIRATPQNPSLHVPRLFVVDKTGMIRADIDDSTPDGFTDKYISAAVDPLLK